MAKQFGVGDAALEGLKDPERHAFPPAERAALRFADAMTRGDGRVPDDLFGELRRHFDEPQVVEIASVIGMFNFFNRFNNALHVEITLMDPGALVRRAGQAAGEARDAAELCDRLASLLAGGRRYARVGIYVRAGGRLDLRAHRGPAPPRSLGLGEGGIGTGGHTGATWAVDEGSPGPAGRGRGAGTRVEIIVPVRCGGEVVGAVAVECDRGPVLDEEDRDLLERVAAILGPRLGRNAAGHVTPQ